MLNIQLYEVPRVLVGFYATQTAFASLIVILMLYFNSFLPKDFARMGRMLNCFGMFLKVLPKLLIFMHYIIFILILVVIGQVGRGQCSNAEVLDSTGHKPPQPVPMQRDATILAGIVSALWVLMHFGGFVIRSLLYVDPFLLDPYDPKANRVYRVMCQTCGP